MLPLIKLCILKSLFQHINYILKMIYNNNIFLNLKHILLLNLYNQFSSYTIFLQYLLMYRINHLIQVLYIHYLVQTCILHLLCLFSNTTNHNHTYFYKFLLLNLILSFLYYHMQLLQNNYYILYKLSMYCFLYYNNSKTCMYQHHSF